MFIAFKHWLKGPVKADEVQPRLLCAGFRSTGEERGEAGSWGHPQLSKQAVSPVPRERWHQGQAGHRLADAIRPRLCVGLPTFLGCLRVLSSGRTDPWGGRCGASPHLAVGRLFGWINACLVSAGSSSGRWGGPIQGQSQPPKSGSHLAIPAGGDAQSQLMDLLHPHHSPWNSGHP